jgi:hypothetical protein
MAKGSEYVNSVPPEIKVGLCLVEDFATRTRTKFLPISAYFDAKFG